MVCDTNVNRSSYHDKPGRGHRDITYIMCGPCPCEHKRLFMMVLRTWPKQDIKAPPFNRVTSVCGIDVQDRVGDLDRTGRFLALMFCYCIYTTY